MPFCCFLSCLLGYNSWQFSGGKVRGCLGAGYCTVLPVCSGIRCHVHSLDQTDVQNQRNLWIRDHRWKEQCVGMPTDFAVHSNDWKREEPVSKLGLASVRAITDETAGVDTDTGNKVKIKRIYRFIVKILRNKVVVLCFNCYHRYVSM